MSFLLVFTYEYKPDYAKQSQKATSKQSLKWFYFRKMNR